MAPNCRNDEGTFSVNDSSMIKSRSPKLAVNHRREVLLAAWWSFGSSALATVLWHVAFAKVVAISAYNMPWVILIYAAGTSSVIGFSAILGFCVALHLKRKGRGFSQHVRRPTEAQVARVLAVKSARGRSTRSEPDLLTPLIEALALPRGL
jgi:hypothetical protein